jgi:hypothetical protein
MLIQGQVGPSSVQSLSSGTNPTIRMGQLGDMVVSELHGRYYEQAYRGSVFSLSVSTAAAITAYIGAAAGQPQIALYNPVGSGKNLAVLQASYNNVVAASGAGTVAWGIWFGPTVAPTAATNAVATNMATLQKAGSVASCWTNTALTSSTALVNQYPVGSYYWATAAGAFGPSMNLLDVGGSIIVPPGTMVALGGSAALTSATWTGNITWEEVPV